MWKWIKRVAISGLVLFAVLAAVGGLWWHDLDLAGQPRADPASTVASLQFMQAPAPARGRVLAVVTSTGQLGDSSRNAGYELTELSRAYYTFVANGYEVDIASPRGGEPPVNIDADDIVAADHAFLNDPLARAKVVTSQQHLCRGHAVGQKNLVPCLHELPLPHSSRSLTRSQTSRFHHTAPTGQSSTPRRHRSRRNQHQTARPLRGLASRIIDHGQITQGGKLRGKPRKHGIAQAAGVRQHGAAHLDHNHTSLGENARALLLPGFSPLFFRMTLAALLRLFGFGRRAKGALPVHVRSTTRYSRV